MASVYQRWVDTLEMRSRGQKLFLFELVFFLSRVALAAFVLLIQMLLERVLILPHPLAFPFNLTGLPLIGIAITLDVWSIWTFLTVGGGTPAPMKPPLRVVSEGPFDYVRNPMYLDVFLTGLGLAVLFDSVLIAIADILAMVVIHFVVVLPEEKKLELKFGKSYVDYKNRVPRWIPTFKGGQDRHLG